MNFLKKGFHIKEYIRNRKSLSFLMKFLHRKELWDLKNKHSVANGLAIGFFVAFIIPIGQFVLSTILCTIFRANIPVAAMGTLITNPFTFVPWYTFAIYIGNLVLSFFDYYEKIPNLEKLNMTNILDMWATLGIAWIIGILILSIAMSLIGYLIVLLSWKYLEKYLDKLKHNDFLVKE